MLHQIQDIFGGCIWHGSFLDCIYNRKLVFNFMFFFRSEGEAWQGLKAPTAHHDQRSKFRQQAAPYIRPNWTTTSSICIKKQQKKNLVNTSFEAMKKKLSICVYQTFLNKSLSCTAEVRIEEEPQTKTLLV